MNAITTQKLTKYYGSSRGIVDVSLSVEEGDLFGFIGPNGAGKSTTIRTLLGLISPTEGSAQIFGKDIVKHKTEILANVGYLPSEAMFYGTMKVGELIKLSADLHKKDCRQEAKRLCERLALDTNKKINELSLGNRKKVGIVCSLQHKPELYLFDEPTSGLDPLMQREFFDLVTERNKEGATVFLSSHILSEVQKYCRHAAVIRDGKILACDTVERLGHTGVKRVMLHGTGELPPIAGVKGVSSAQNEAEFFFSGDIRELMAALAALPLTDVTVSDPTLDEVFMHYYTAEGQNDGF